MTIGDLMILTNVQQTVGNPLNLGTLLTPKTYIVCPILMFSSFTKKHEQNKVVFHSTSNSILNLQYSCYLLMVLNLSLYPGTTYQDHG